MSRYSVIVVTFASTLLAVAEPPAASAHGSPFAKWVAGTHLAAASPPARQPAPAALCEECEDLAEKLKQAQERHRNLLRLVSETTDRLAKMRAEQAAAQAQLADLRRNAPRGGELDRMMAELERRLSNIQANIKQLSDSLQRFEAQEHSLSFDIVVLSIELDACNKRCNRTSPPPDPPSGTGVRPGQSGTPGATPAPPVAKCPDCQSAADRLKGLQDQRRDLAERLEGYQAEAEKLEAGFKSPDERSRGAGLRRLGLGLRLGTIMVGLGDELRKLDEEIARAAAELKKCTERCETKETGSLFTKPVIYAVAAAVVSGGVLAATGGGDGTPTQASSTSTTTTNFTVAAEIRFLHLSGGGSELRGVIVPTPPLPGADYTVQTTGPGVISGQQTVSGKLDSSGMAMFQIPITSLGTYTSIITVTSSTGVRNSVTVTTTVT